MPSNAYKAFNDNIDQVNRLLKAYNTAKGHGRGKKALDHFTRAALLFLCSSWEVYIEQVTNEAGQIITERISQPSQLPMPVKKKIASIIKNANDQLTPIKFADDWRAFYIKQINICTTGLNTPKKQKILDLFQHYLGIADNRTLSDVPELAKIDAIVTVRGQIAHNVFAETYLKKSTVDSYCTTISKAVKEIEILLWNYLPEITNGKRPWQNTYT